MKGKIVNMNEKRSGEVEVSRLVDFPISGDFACEVCGRSFEGLSLGTHTRLECKDGILTHLLQRIEALEWKIEELRISTGILF